QLRLRRGQTAIETRGNLMEDGKGRRVCLSSRFERRFSRFDMRNKLRREHLASEAERLEQSDAAKHLAAIVAGHSNRGDSPGETTQIDLVGCGDVERAVRHPDGFFRAI